MNMKVHMLNGLRKHDLLGANIVEEAPSYMVRYDLNTMENDIDWLQDHTSANQEYPEWWNPTDRGTRQTQHISELLDYAIDDRQVPTPARTMDGLGEDLVPVEEDVPGMKIKPIGGSPGHRCFTRRWAVLLYSPY